MYIPYRHAARPAISSPGSVYHGFVGWSNGIGSYPENWNSLIGIVTAIGGNILISFALNMQRYAHTRIDREWQEKERQRKKHGALSASLVKLDGRRQRQAGYDASESDPLIPQSPTSTLSEGRSSLKLGQEEEEEQEQEQASHEHQSYLKSPYWWLGIILMTTGEAGNFLAYGFAPASIVSLLGVVALVSNCVIAPFMLKEPFRKRDALGVVIAVGGAVTVVLSASNNNPKLGPEEIWDLIRRWEFEAYLGITVTVITALMVCSNRFGEKSILIDLGLVGLFGGYTALSTKGIASLLSYTLWRVITFPVFYLLVAILAGTAIMQIKYLNRALQRFDATQVIPIQFVLFTLSVIGGSAILYRDFERTSSQHAGEFVGGCALTFFGVWLITSGRSSQHGEKEEDREPEPEDAINLIEERYRDDVDGANGRQDSSGRRSSTARTSSPPIGIHKVLSRPRYRDDLDSQAPSPNNSDVPNSWTTTNSQSDHLRPDISRYTSTPILPSEAAPSAIASTLNTELPSTPIRGCSQGELSSTPTLTCAAAQSRLRRHSRQAERLSRPGLSGPLLTSPLSTTLSAMVQDIKRAGTVRQWDVDTLAKRRQGDDSRGSSVGARLLGEAVMQARSHSEMPTTTTVRDQEFQDTVLEERRKRSLSGTLDSTWHRCKRAEDEAGDREQEYSDPSEGSGGGEQDKQPRHV